MFISLSKTIGKVGGFRIGIGKRITSKNAWWLCIVICFVAMFKLMWYMCVLSFWLMYAMLYGMWWCCKKTIQLISRAIGKGESSKFSNNDVALERLQANTYGESSLIDISNSDCSTSAVVGKPKYCPSCGAEIKRGNGFCIQCGARID